MAEIPDINEVWRDVDRRLRADGLPVEEAIKELIERGAIRRAVGFAVRERGYIYMLEPARENLVPGPCVLVDFGPLYGGPRLYRPFSDEMRWDTGAFSFE